MSFYVVFDNFIGLLADALPRFLGGAILGVALETFLPTTWAMRWLGSLRASFLHANVYVIVWLLLAIGGGWASTLL